MRIIDVKVKSIDESTPFLYPHSRSIEIRTSSNNIMTPTRAATDYEYHQKALVPTDIPIDNPVYVSVQDLSFREFDKFLHTNGYYANLISRMELKSRLSQYSDLRLFLVKPTKSDRKDEKTGEIQIAPMKNLTQNPAMLDRFITFIVRMQLEAGVNPITIPFLDLPLSSYKELIMQVAKSIEREGKQSVFFVDMGYTDFQEIIGLLINQLDSNLIGLYFRPYRHAHLGYETLREYYSKDVAFLAIQVNRTDLFDISTMHYLPFFGNDIYAIRRPLGFLKTKIDEKGNRIKIRPAYSVDKIQFFDRKSLCVQPMAKTPSLIDDYVMEYSQDQRIPYMLRNYRNANGIEHDYDVLNAFSKISELRSSSQEFRNLQKYIKENSAQDYVDEKSVLKHTLENFKRSSSSI